MKNILRGTLVLIMVLVTTIASAAGKNSPPLVSLTSPATGATFAAPATISLTASASDTDGTVSKVQFYQGTTLLGTSTASPYTFNWTNVAVGNYSLTAKATDNSGSIVTSAAVSITVTSAPIIASPANGVTIYSNTVTVSGTFTGSAYTSTVLVDNGNSSVVATIPYNSNNYSVTLPIFLGTNTITVHVDQRDKTFETASITVIGGASPSVALTSPTQSSFYGPLSLTLAASALSPSGSIKNVVFTQNGITLATVATPPYQYVWNNVVNGSYVLRAIATDINGASATAFKNITVTAPDQPPTVSLTAPANSSYFFAPATINVQANATDVDGTVSVVQFLANNNQIGASYVAPYSFNWTNVPTGNYTLTAIATDNGTNQTTSSPVSITVYPSDVPPTVSLTSPTSGQVFAAPANINLSANAADSDGSVAKVDFYQGSTLLGTAASAPYNLQWQNVPSGSYSLKAVATDNQGAYTTSAVASVTVTTPPTVSLTFPNGGQTFNAPANITVSASAADSDGTISRVDFYQGFILIGSSVSAPYAIDWQNVSQGSYSLTAVATDNASLHTTSAPVSITVNPPDVPPTVSLTSPTSGTTLWTPGNVTLTANAADSDGTVSKVDFFQGSTLLGTATSAPYSFTWVNPPLGSYTVTAVATDNAGMATTSTTVSITVNALQVVITSPQAYASLSGVQAVITGTFQGPINSGLTVNNYVAAVDSNNHFYANVPLKVGSNTVTAAINTASGQSVSNSINVTMDGQQPLLQLSVDATEGISPLIVNFSFTNNRTQNVSLQVNGGQPTTVVVGSTYVVTATMNGASASQFQFAESDSAGNMSTQTYVIVASDSVQMDQTFTALWNGMNNALVVGDKATALTYLSQSARGIYGPVFDSLMPVYSQIISSWSPPLRGQLSAEVGEYGVVTTDSNGVGSLFLIYFLRGTDGIWRLDSM